MSISGSAFAWPIYVFCSGGNHVRPPCLRQEISGGHVRSPCLRPVSSRSVRVQATFLPASRSNSFHLHPVHIAVPREYTNADCDRRAQCLFDFVTGRELASVGKCIMFFFLANVLGLLVSTCNETNKFPIFSGCGDSGQTRKMEMIMSQCSAARPM